MFDYMLPTFKNVFTEIGSVNLTSQVSIDGLSTYDLAYLNELLGVNIPSNHIFNWNQFHYFISLEGLHNTEAFNNEIKNNPEKYALYKAYTYIGKKMLSKNCN